MKTFTISDPDVDLIINSDRLRQTADAEKEQMRKERDAARAKLKQMQQVAGIATLTLVLVILGGIAWLWFRPPAACEQPPSPPPPLPECTSCRKPVPPPRPGTPSRGYIQKCGASDGCWEYPSCRIHNRSKYEDGECWRDRSTQGGCFD